MGISGTAKYAQINAVVHALYADKLSVDKLRSLAAMDDYEAVLAALEATSYGPYLAIPAELRTPRRVVYQFHVHLAAIYQKLIRLAPKSTQVILQTLWQAYEVDNLKAILRGIYHHATWNQVLYLLSPINAHNLVKLNTLERMLQTGSISRAIDVIKDTPYYFTLSYALNRYQKENTLFPLEIALDLDYRRRLWREIDNLHGEDHDNAIQLLGEILDKDKLIWAMRFRYYHNLSAEEIINYTLERGYRLQDKDIYRMAQGECIADSLEERYPTIENVKQICSNIDRNIGLLEHKLDQDIQNRCHDVFRSGPFHIGVTLAYVLMLEYEIKVLTAIVEAKSMTNRSNQNLAGMLESYV